MNKIISLITLLYFSIISIQAQYYVSNINLSGIEYSQGLTECEDAAQILANELPLNYIDSFKVFSFGYYLHSDKFSDGESRLQELALSSVQNQVPYYLVIIRVMNNNSAIEKIKVFTKLPIYDSLHCLIADQFTLISSNIANTISSEINKSEITSFNYLLAEVKGMKYLQDFIIDKKICCGSRMPSCFDCAPVEEFESFLKTEGFSILNTDGIDYTNITENSAYLEQSAELIINYEEDELNVNNDVETFINEFSQYTTQVKASIDYYGSGNCDILSKMIELNTFDKSKPYIELKVVGYECNGSKIATKLFTNLKQSPDFGTKTLYVINMDQSINTERLIDSTISFMKKAKLDKINVNELDASDKCKFGKTDGLVIVGTHKSKIFEYARNTKEVDEFVYEQDYKEFMVWVNKTHESAIEHAEHFLGMVSSNSINVGFWYTQWNNAQNKLSSEDAFRKYRLLGFIILHVTSHMADYEHWHNNYPTPANVLVGDGYGADAPVITGYLDDPVKGPTFERLIDWTRNFNKKMVDATYTRFGF